LGVAFHSFRNKNAAQALKHAPTTPAEIVEAIGHERGFTVETYLTVWLLVPRLGPTDFAEKRPITLNQRVQGSSPCVRKLRIWGSGVRISSGAPKLQQAWSKIECEKPCHAE